MCIRDRISIGLTVVVGVLVVLAFVMLVFGRPIGDAITSRVGLDGAFNTVWSVVQIVGPIPVSYTHLTLPTSDLV